jgi:hypothetical protein
LGPATPRDYQVRSERPAHPSNRLVAQFNETWRVVDDRLQWRLQRKKGNPRSKNAGWRDRSFCTTRERLLRCVREYCGSVEPSALAMLTDLPEHYGMQNLDVRGTDQAQADGQSERCLQRHWRIVRLVISRLAAANLLLPSWRRPCTQEQVQQRCCCLSRIEREALGASGARADTSPCARPPTS